MASVVILGRWILDRRQDARLVLGLLAVLWAWSGMAYHWWHFHLINPAAPLIAAGFVAQAVMFAWIVPRGGTIRQNRSRLRLGLGVALLAFGLFYPGLGLAVGLSYPRMPMFAVPCPTVLVTAGVLVMAPDLPRWLSVLPLLWAVIGGSAAFNLGMRADLGLLVAAGVLGVNLVAPLLLGKPDEADGT